jgi:hypothetical protein
MQLHLDSIKDAELKKKMQQQRELVAIQAYDWNLVKRVSQEHQFYRYVEALVRAGKALLKEEEEEHTLLLASLAKTEDNRTSVSSESDKKKSSKEPTRQGSLKTPESSMDFMENLKLYMQTSPFRKRAEALHIIDPNTYSFGKPPQLREENEFQRTFAELDSLGSTMVHRHKTLEVDTDLFSIPPTIVCCFHVGCFDRLAA